MVFNIRPAERAGAEMVFIRRCGGSDDRAAQLCVIADKNVVAIVTRSDTALLLHGGVIVVDFAAAHAGAALHRHAGTDRRHADAGAETDGTLLAVVAGAILLAGQRQVIFIIDAAVHVFGSVAVLRAAGLHADAGVH